MRSSTRSTRCNRPSRRRFRPGRLVKAGTLAAAVTLAAVSLSASTSGNAAAATLSMRDAAPSPSTVATASPVATPPGTSTRPPAVSHEREHSSARPDRRPVLYLTFDDGPDRVRTPMVLNLLRKYDAHATFFMVGSYVNLYPGLVRAVLADGHAIGDHTWDHADLTHLSGGAIDGEIQRTAAALHRAGVDEMRCVRPPYGAVNGTVRAHIASLGYKTVLWDVDPRDWSNPGVGHIVSQLLSARPGQIVLLHDAGVNHTDTLPALAQALPTLAKKFRLEPLPCN